MCAPCLTSTRSLLAEHKAADAAGAYLVQSTFQVVAPSRTFCPSLDEDAAFILAEVRQEMDLPGRAGGGKRGGAARVRRPALHR